MDDREEVLAVCWFVGRGGIVTAEKVNEMLANEREQPGLDMAPCLSELQAEGLLEAVEGGWQLTVSGREVSHALATQMMAEGFDRELVRHYESACFTEYCERVFGTDLFQFNMVDEPQRVALIDVLALQPGERFADVGCALGTLTEWIAQRADASGLGIDLAPNCIARANARTASDPRLEFRVGNLDALELPRLDAVVFIDTLYFCSDIEATVRTAVAALRPGGRFAAFFTAKKGRDDGLEIDQIRVGKALIAAGLDPAGIDFTAQGHGVWERAVQACEDLEEAWHAEGNGKMQRDRLREGQAQLARYVAGESRRWLVHARVPG